MEKTVRKNLKEYAIKIINFEKKKMLPLTSKELKFCKEADKCYICEIRFFKSSSNSINYRKFRDHSHFTRCGTQYLQFKNQCAQ